MMYCPRAIHRLQDKALLPGAQGGAQHRRADQLVLQGSMRACSTQVEHGKLFVSAELAAAALYATTVATRTSCRRLLAISASPGRPARTRHALADTSGPALHDRGPQRALRDAGGARRLREAGDPLAQIHSMERPGESRSSIARRATA
jgi:hypothetical protein